MKQVIINAMEKNNNKKASHFVTKLEVMAKELENMNVAETVRRIPYSYIERFMMAGIAPTKEEMEGLETLIRCGSRAVGITTAAQLKKIMKVIKSKAAVSQLQITIDRNRDNEYRGSITSISTSVGRAFREAIVEDVITVPYEGGIKTRNKFNYGPFTKGFISLVVKDDAFLNGTEDVDILVRFAEEQTDAYLYNDAINKYVSVINNRKYTPEEIKELPGELREYKAVIFSPSDVRNKNCTYKDVTNGDDREEYMERISGGAYGMAKVEHQELVDSGASPEKINISMMKTMVRFGQLKASSVNLGKISKWLYYTEAFELASGQVVDGTGYVRASYFAELLSDYLGMEVDPKAVCFFIQLRPGMQKGAYQVLPDSAFNVLANKLVSTGKTKVIGSDANNDAVKINMICDKNVVKLHSDYSMDVDFELLDVGQTSSASTSKQMLLKVLVNTPEVAKEYISRKMNESLFETFKRDIAEVAPKIPTINEVQKGFVQNIAKSIAPKFATSDHNIYSKLIKTYAQGRIKAIDRLRFEIEGCNNRLTSDISELYLGVGIDNSVLKYGEIFSPEANKFFMKKYLEEAKTLGFTTRDEVIAFVEAKILETEIVMIKYPSTTVGEFYRAKLITPREIARRLASKDGSNQEKKAVLEFFTAVEEGLTILPARKVIMYKCAGLDYDYDGATFIFDQELVNMYRAIPETADCIEG